MKEVFVIGCYIRNELQLSYLSELIYKLKKQDKDFIIVSHSHIPDFLVKDSIAYVYDSDNHIISSIDTGIIKRWWYFNDDFRLGSPSLSYGSVDNYSVAAQNLLNRGLLLSRSFGYDVTHWIEYDFDLDVSHTNDNFEIIKDNPEVGMVAWWCKNISYHPRDTVSDHIFGSLITINNHLINTETIQSSKEKIIEKLKEVEFVCEVYTEKNITTGLVYKKEMNDSIENRYSSKENTNHQFAIFEENGKLTLFLLNVSHNKIDLEVNVDNNIHNLTLNVYYHWIMLDIGYPSMLRIKSEFNDIELDLSNPSIYNYYVTETIMEDITR